MTTNRIPYRCMKCRGRNTLAKPIEAYKKTPVCKHGCGCNRYYIDWGRVNRTDICRDEECCHYPHRYKSTLCRHHPEHEFMTRVHRYGEDPQTVMIDIAFDSDMDLAPASAEVPF